MTFDLRPQTFDGTDIQDAPTTYKSSFLAAHDVLSAPSAEPIEVEIPGAYPESPRSQDESRVIPLFVELMASTQTALNNFKKLFDKDKGDCILVAQDGDAVDWRLTVRVIGTPNFSQAARAWIVRLYVARPVWQSDAEHATVETKSASPATFTVTNAGTVKAYPVIDIKPTVVKAHSAGYLHRWRYTIASRTPLRMMDTQGLPYPLDVAAGALDTATEIGASRMQADGDDLRVLVDGTEARRDLSGINGANTKVWSALAFDPMQRAVLAANMTAGSPANGESIAAVRPDEFSGWAHKGFVVIGTERIYYGDRTDGALLEILRGSYGTTAAGHTAGDYIYNVEHNVEIISDYTAATEPNGTDVDQKPVIDLANSTNLKHVHAGPFTAFGTRRPGQWVPGYAEDVPSSALISFLDGGGAVVFRDIAPSAAAGQFNRLELYCPCGIKVAAGAITHDIAIQDALGLDVKGFDLGGYRSLVARYASDSDGAAVTLTPPAVLSRLRYEAFPQMITGADCGDVSETILNASWSAQQFTLDQVWKVYGFMARLKKVDAPAGNIEMALFTDDSDDLGDMIAGPFTITMATLTTNFADILARVLSQFPIGYIVMGSDAAATKYWLAVRRTLLGAGSVSWALNPIQTYAGGLFRQVTGGGIHGPESSESDSTQGDEGKKDWAGLANLKASDNAHATVGYVAHGDVAEYLDTKNFGFAIDAGESVQQIIVQVEGKVDTGMVIGRIGLLKAGVPVGILERADWLEVVDTVKTFSGQWQAVLWGTTWTPAEINAATFGVRLSLFQASEEVVTFSIDHIQITVVTAESAVYVTTQTADFGIFGSGPTEGQAEAPTGTEHEAEIDNVEVTFDDATPLTPLIVRGAQETIYELNGVLSNDETGEEVAVHAWLEINDILRIDCYNKTVKLIPADASDPTIDVPWAITPSDLVDWLTFIAGAQTIRWVEAGMGTIAFTPTFRDPWA